MKIKNIEDIEDIENNIPNEKILLYSEFLEYFWDKCADSYSKRRVEYFKEFYMLPKDKTFQQDAVNLILWMIIKNENKLPDNLQKIFDEWCLENNKGE